jgi:hypothetical protein
MLSGLRRGKDKVVEFEKDKQDLHALGTTCVRMSAGHVAIPNQFNFAAHRQTVLCYLPIDRSDPEGNLEPVR